MPVTQRDTDIMELESELRIKQVLKEWQAGFLGERVPLPAITSQDLDTPAEQEVPNDDSVLSGV